MLLLNHLGVAILCVALTQLGVKDQTDSMSKQAARGCYFNA